jgi:type II secretory pathway predicted ATPase ExeA
MYYQHFGLHRPPFKITPDTDFFFSGGNRGAVLDALIYAVTDGEGIVKVTGEVGSGKTMLCHMLQARLPPHIEQIYLANPSVSPEEILRAIAFELGLQAARDASRLELMHALQDHLVKRHAEGRQVVVFVEESQSMPVATLEEIRLLSNLETRQHKLLQIVLFGQPELDELLGQPNIRQLRERIAHSFSLQPLRYEEIREYLMFRLRAAGYRGPDLFSPRVVRRIADVSGGLSRRVNLVADKALLAAFADNTHTVSLAHVRAAVRDSAFGPRSAPGPGRWGAAFGLLATGAVLGIAAFWWLGGQRPAPLASSVGETATQPVAGSASAGGPATAAAPTTVPVNMDRRAAPESAAAPPPPDGPAPSDERQANRAATKDRVERPGRGTFSIQLSLAPDDPDEIERHLSAIGQFVDSGEVYVHRTRMHEKPYAAILYGSFPSRRAAQDALDRLPKAVKSDRPYVRPMPVNRDETLRARHRTSG